MNFRFTRKGDVAFSRFRKLPYAYQCNGQSILLISKAFSFSSGLLLRIVNTLDYGLCCWHISSCTIYGTGHFQVPLASVSKRVQVKTISCENEFNLHENEPAGGTHFNDFAQASFDVKAHGNSEITHTLNIHVKGDF